MRQFVPMTDELLYDRDHPPGPLVPYRCGIPCWHRLQAADVDPAAAVVPRGGRDDAVSASPSADRRP